MQFTAQTDTHSRGFSSLRFRFVGVLVEYSRNDCNNAHFCKLWEVDDVSDDTYDSRLICHRYEWPINRLKEWTIDQLVDFLIHTTHWFTDSNWLVDWLNLTLCQTLFFFFFQEQPNLISLSHGWCSCTLWTRNGYSSSVFILWNQEGKCTINQGFII